MQAYAVSIYWAFTTMSTMGYGDIRPTTDNEKIFVIIAMIIACGTFAYIVGSIGTIVEGTDSIINEFK